MALLSLPPKRPSFAQRLADGPKPFGAPGKDVQLRGQTFLKEFASRKMPTTYYVTEATQVGSPWGEEVSLTETDLDDLQVYESPLVPTHTRKVRRVVTQLVAPSYPDPFDEDGSPLP